MLTDAELKQMLADAAEMQRLRDAATPGPWVFDVLHDWGIATERDDRGFSRTVINSRKECEEWDCQPVTSIENGDFIAAARSDKSAAHVERLVQEVRRLRALAQLQSEWGMKMVAASFEENGIPLPDMLKPYASEENANG